MKKSWANIKVGLKIALVYRFDFIVSLVTTPISLIVFYFLWTSIYNYMGVDVIKGFTLPMMISYYVLNMIVGFFTWSGIDGWIEHDVVNGNIILDLLRPIDYFTGKYFFELGLNLMAVIFEALPIFILGVIFFNLALATPVNLIFFLISLFLASVLYFLLSYLLGLSSFWLKRITGLRRAKKPLISFFGGGLIPLTFFPAQIRMFLDYLPFAYTRFVPISLYLGSYTYEESIIKLLIQLAWVIVLYWLAKNIWKKAVQKFSGVGV